MKTIKEKAKRYDEAYKVAESIHRFSSNPAEIKRMEEIFPSLKEYDGERIRNVLIGWINLESSISFGDTFDGFSKEQILVWLEKHGDYSKLVEEIKKRKELLSKEKENAISDTDKLSLGGRIAMLEELLVFVNEEQGKPVEINPSKFDSQLNKLLKQFETLPKEELINSLNFYLNVVQNNGTYKEKKQCEKPQGKSAVDAINEEKVDNQNCVKPSIKDEPKFRVGDWCIDNEDGTIFQIVKVLDNSYKYRTNEGKEYSCTHYSLELDARLWTISDAKEGDVLHSTGLHNDCIFIFNGLDNWKFDEPNGDRAVATGYCCLSVSADNMEFGMQGPDCVEVNTVKPATKIQRDLLFRKIKEAGYEWNDDKKELKKIEQKYATMSLDEAIEHCKEKSCGNNACASEHKQLEKWLTELKELKEQKPWKCYYVENPVPMVVKDSMLVEWLKSLKGRVGNFDDGYKVGVSAAKHNQWKPSAEQIEALDWALSLAKNCGEACVFDLRTLQDQIKKLK